MANQILTPTMIAQEMALRVRNALIMGNSVHREFKREFTAGRGASVNIRKPTFYEVGTQTVGSAATTQDLTEPYTSITVDKQKYVLLKYNSQEKAMSIEDFSERHIAPAATALANQVDLDLTALYKDVPNAVLSGTDGTTTTGVEGFATIARAGKILDSFGVPNDKLTALFGPSAYWDMSVAMQNVFNEPINKKIMRQNSLGRFGNFDTFMSQNIRTSGTAVWGTANMVLNGSEQGEVTVAGTHPDGTVAVDGGTAGNVVNAGDVVQFAGIYSLNPVTRESTNLLRQFAVVTTATVGTAGNIVIRPGVVVDGAYQNVSAALPDGGTMTVLPATTAARNTRQNLLYHHNAFALVMVPLPLPEGAAWSRRSTIDGISVRLVKDYNITTDEEVVRVDILYGVKTINGDLAVRVLGG